MRSLAAHEELREAVRSGVDPEDVIERTLQESTRSRPAIPLVGRMI